MGKNKITNTQQIVDVQEIKNGVIETKDGRYVKIIEFNPINFHLRSNKERNNIIYDFAAWLKTAPVKFQIKSMAIPANIEKYIDKIQGNIENEDNENCKKLQADYLNLICNVGLKEGVTRRFFIILEFNKVGVGTSSYPDIVNNLNTAAQSCINMLSRCGNTPVDFSDSDTVLYDLFHKLYNRIDYESVGERANFIVNEYIKNEKDVSKGVPADNILAPYFVAVKKDYMVVNDTWYTFLYIPSENYRTNVYAGWLSGIVNAGEGIDVDMFFKKENKQKIKEKIGQRLRLNAARIKDTQDTNSDYDDISDAISSGYYMKNQILNGEEFYYMDTLITITAPSKEILDYKTNAIQEMLVSQDFEGKICEYHMLDAFRSVMPLCNIDKSIHERAHRNILTYGVASSYMLTSFEISDDDGILFGINKQNDSLCIVDLFNSEKYKNANVSILGTTGAGKTFLMQTMALRFRMKDIQTFIIAPLKGHEFKRAATAIGGSYIKLSPGSQNTINIMEIRPIDKRNEILLDGDDIQKDDSILLKKMQNLHAFFSLIIPNMSQEEIQIIDNTLIDVYKNRGITKDNDSLIDVEKTDKLRASLLLTAETAEEKQDISQKVVYKKMPILEDVYNSLMKSGYEQAKRLALVMDRYIHGSASSFNAQTNVNLENKYVVVDISEFNEELQPIGMFVVLDYIYDKVKEDRTKKKAVFVDETWKLIGANSNPLAANFVLEIFKIIRGYGGAAVAATQDIADFFGLENGKYGRGIIANSKTKIILQLEPNEAETVQDIFDLSEQETMNISRFERGNGLVVTNSNNVPVKFTASPMEEMLITTDRKRLEELLNQIKQQ